MTETCSGEAALLFIFIFTSNLIRDQLFRKNLLLGEQILFKDLISNEMMGGGTPKRTFFPLRGDPILKSCIVQEACPFTIKLPSSEVANASLLSQYTLVGKAFLHSPKIGPVCSFKVQ